MSGYVNICEKHKSIIAGQTFRGYYCSECGEEGLWSNTATPKLCKECAIKLNKCQYCGC